MEILTLLAWLGLGLLGLIWLGNLNRLLRSGADPRWRLWPERYPDARPSARVSVIVPARNEERNIEACVRALLAQDHANLELRVVDDRSDDRTPEILAALAAEDPRLVIVPGAGPPPGWTGKVAACWRGQAEASGEVLLFVDADVQLHPATLRQSLAYLEESGADGLSLIGKLVTVGFWEHVVQPVVGSLVMSGNPPSKVNDPAEPAAAMANGQFILVRRDAYDAVGGHEAVRQEVLDDVGFARLMKARGRRLHLLMGMSLLSVRMYTSLREIWDGWTKNLFLGLHRSVGLSLAVWLGVFAVALLPFLLALGLPLGHALAGQEPVMSPSAWASAAVAALIYGTYGLGLARTGHRAWWFWSYPLGVVVLLGILANSALRGSLRLGVQWKGRVYTELGSGHPEREGQPPHSGDAAPPRP